MERKNKKCSLPEHKEIEAVEYCFECKILMCNKCDKNHSCLFKSHHIYKIDKDDINDIFTGFCKEENHLGVLEFFCKNHNKLCCASCLCKIKKKSKGQHHDCDVCVIEEIKDEKKDKLNYNIKYLDDLSKSLENSLKDLKNILEKINENKEKLKLDIQNIFTKIRNTINEREDQLLIEVDKKFDEVFFKEDFIKECEKLPNKIKMSLENGKKIQKDWNDNKLNFLINDCINLENNIQDINKIEEIRKKSNLNDNSKSIIFTQKEDEINNIINSIKVFGNINNENNVVHFPSEILNGKEDDKALILSWLPIKPKKLTLLLNSRTDGDSCITLVEKCRGKTPTLVVIKTTKDIIFGGYTTQEWKLEENIKDEKAFVYSLKTKKKYIIKKPEYSNYVANSWWGFGPNINTIILYNNCLKRSDNWVGDGAYDIPQPFELNGGEKTFGVKSYEIFHLE